MKNKFLLFVLLCMAMAGQAQTTIENFNYGSVADTLTKASVGGSNWTVHNGSIPLLYSPNSLSYPGYVSSGIGGSANFIFGSGSRADANRLCINYNSGSVYASFLCRITNAGGTSGDYFFHVMDKDSMTQFRGRIFIKNGSVANTFNVGLSKGTTTVAYSSTNYPLDSTILIVMKYTFSPGSLVNDTAKAYIFFQSAIPATEPATANLVATDISQGDMARINAVAIRQGSTGTMTGFIDGIRVSNTWADGPLPVKFISFDAKLDRNIGTILQWKTAQERNNKGFEIEMSTDGSHFESIGFVDGAGNSQRTQAYEFIASPFTAAYYRIKQIDFDGNFEYSEVVYSGNQESEMAILPNPFVASFSIQSNQEIQKIELIDLTGRVVLSENINALEANINTSELPKGIYFINIYQGTKVNTQRIIKTN
jgi:hypothetical protein